MQIKVKCHDCGHEQTVITQDMNILGMVFDNICKHCQGKDLVAVNPPTHTVYSVKG